MASRRMGKKTAGSSGGPPSKRQATLRNHGIEFNTPEQWSRYKSILSKPLHPSRYPDYYSMNKLGIRDNAYRLYLQRIMSCTIWGRKEVGRNKTDELFMLWAMLSNSPVNTCYHLLDYLASIGAKSNNRAEIVVGGIITFIARKFGVGEDNEMNTIEGNNRLTIETLISMNFIKHHPPANITYELRLNITLLFILPNPSRTNTGVEANLLYVGVDLQVYKEHNLGEEEGANLDQDEEHQDYEAGGHSDDERWAWMQTEIERISTEQQGQGVEITGLRNDVLRGNRINEDNNQMLRNMM